MVNLFTPTNQIRYTNVSVVRYRKCGKRFEVACYMNKVSSWRNGYEKDINEVLQTVQVFSNAIKGTIAKNEDIKTCFNSDDVLEVCKEILQKGEYNLSEKERKELINSLFLDIAHVVSTKTINPNSKKPYPQSIVEKAMRDSGFSVNINRNVKQQALEVIKLLAKNMPLVRSRIKAKIVCDSEFSQQIDSFLKSDANNDQKVELIDKMEDCSIKKIAFMFTLEPGQLKSINAQLEEIRQKFNAVFTFDIVALQESDIL